MCKFAAHKRCLDKVPASCGEKLRDLTPEQAKEVEVLQEKQDEMKRSQLFAPIIGKEEDGVYSSEETNEEKKEQVESKEEQEL